MTTTVTREDIERKLGEIQGSISSRAQDAGGDNMRYALIAGVVLILLAYLLGRRKGKKKTTVVEIRRV